MAKRSVRGRMKKMTREDRKKRDERNAKRGRDSKAIAYRKNKVIPGAR